MVFVTAGMGGGTGTGAAPVIAQAARESGILTVGVITKPFHFEGSHRMKLAESGIAELQKYVDTLIIIPNQNLFRIANEKTTFADAFRMADDVLQSGVRGVTDLMVMPGLINLDFADIRAVMAEMGKAMMGTGEAMGERRATEAAEAAISNPLLDDISMKGARGVLINVTGGLDMTLFEVDEAANRIRDEVDPEANIIFGSTFDESMQGKMRVSVVATGIEVAAGAQPKPLPLQQGFEAPVQRRAVNTTPVQPARSPAGYAGFSARGQQSRNADFVNHAPAGVMPTPAHAGHAVMARAAATPAFAGAGTAHETPAMTVGHAASAPYTAEATARKMDTAELVLDEPRPQAHTIERKVAVQPRAERLGNTFIPPKPVDPRTNNAVGDLFAAGRDPVAAQPAAPPAPVAEKPVRKSPSFFERFSFGKGDDEVAETPTRETAAPKLSVEAGGAGSDDDLDIPAFLRRQAN